MSWYKDVTWRGVNINNLASLDGMVIRKDFLKPYDDFEETTSVEIIIKLITKMVISLITVGLSLTLFQTCSGLVCRS